MNHDLLLEIGTEELPAGFIETALTQMERQASKDLEQLRIGSTSVHVYGTPRRLALLVEGLPERQADLLKETKGPSAAVAFAEDGSPTRAATGFARGQGVDVEQLEVRDTEQGKYVYAVTRTAGAPTAEVVADWLPGFITSIQFPKSMRWGDGSLRFARPVRWLVALFADDVLSVELDGLKAGTITYGHRFLAPDGIALARPSEYVERLRAAHVLVDPEERKQAVAAQVELAAEEVKGSVVDDGTLVAEVANLVEYPYALTGSFAEQYLSLPDDVLITPMREHQRYFPLTGADGQLLPLFITVSNGSRAEPDVVRTGNEKVLAARLDDARFFYDEDTKQPLREYVEKLKDVVFQQQLGTVHEKTLRVQALAADVGEQLKVDEAQQSIIERGGLLAKADLVTQMVYEFPELQGVIGREYARVSGEDKAVAEVVYEHYLPRHAGDDLPKTPAGMSVSIADKLDTIVGCFGVGLIPTGSQDPYALRRQALGVVRIVMDNDLKLNLGSLLQRARQLLGDKLTEGDETLAKVNEFFKQRLRGVLLERGLRHDVVEATIATDFSDVAAVGHRARALDSFAQEADFESLMTAYERVANLAKGADGTAVDTALFEVDAEHSLFARVVETEEQLSDLIAAGNFAEVFNALANLRPYVDQLFEDVMVMAPDEKVRRNRLALLRETLSLFNAPADLSKIVI